MPTKPEIIENLNWVTQRISDRIWTISVGILAASLTYVIESSQGSGTPFLRPEQVAIPAALSLLALACDLTQYMAANRQNYLLLRKMEAEGLTEAKYDASQLMPRVRMLAYRAKFYLCITAVIWLATISVARVLELSAHA